MSTTQIETKQVYLVFIKATPEQIWEAITNPDLTEKYFYGIRIDADFRPGGRLVHRSADGQRVLVEAEVIESDPPRRLVHGWRSLYNPEFAEEPASRVTWEIEPQDGGFSKLMLVHDQLDESPKTAEGVSGEGWMTVLSGLKTLLETGEPPAS